MIAVSARNPVLSGRATIEREPGRVRIVMPALKANGVALAAVLPALVMGLVAFPVLAVADGAPAGVYAFLVLFAVVGLGVAAWVFAGREEVTVTRDEIVLAHVLGRLRWRRRYAREIVREIRVDVRARDKRLTRVDEVGLTGGSIVVQRAFSEERFGVRLDEDEARRVVEAIEEVWS